MMISCDPSPNSSWQAVIVPVLIFLWLKDKQYKHYNSGCFVHQYTEKHTYINFNLLLTNALLLLAWAIPNIKMALSETR